MAKEEYRLETPPGKMLTSAMRQEAAIDESNERTVRAIRWRRLADRLDNLMDGANKRGWYILP